MEKRKDFVGMDPKIHKLAKVNASAQGVSIRKYLAHLITTDTERRKNAISI